MIDVVKHTTEYFKPPKDYFWNWGDNGEVIEWKNGSTICYRDDLVFVLDKLTSQGFPPLGAILLVIASCNDNFSSSGGTGILTNLTQVLKNYNDIAPDQEVLQYHLNGALKFMDVIAGLPKELRTGQQRIHLIREIFEPSTFVISDTPLKNIVNELNSGSLDNLIFSASLFPVQADTFKTDLEYLSKAAQKYLSAESLAIRLRTGLDSIPVAAPAIIAPSSPLDLFDELAQERKTAGLAKLAKRLIAALNIPLHSQGSGDQSYGGISDITNRGNYDKLLLSELAHDELLLMARLVNNEALYFRREEPPDNPKRQRTILLDTCIRMWGVPRIFALSAALACTQNTKHNELVEAYSLGGKQYLELDLSTKEGIIKALEVLDHSLHCGPSLHSIINGVQALDQNEYFFITGASQFESPDFQFFYSTIRESLHFIITVNRNGELKFYSCRNGVTKLLTKAKFDLEELLFTPVKNIEPDPYDYEIPAFINQPIAPLYFPAARLNTTDTEKTADLGNNGIITITETQRVLWWHQTDKGAREVLDYIEKGKYFFGANENGWLYIFVNNQQRNLQKLYKINLHENRTEILVDIQIPPASNVIFQKDFFLVQTPINFSGHSYQTGEKTISCSFETFYGIDDKFKQNIKPPDIQKVSKYFYNNYSILFNVKTIQVSQRGELVLGKHHLRLHNNNTVLKFVDESDKITGQKNCNPIVDIKSMLHNKHIKFRKAAWENGSEAIIDSRGFIHLRNSNTAIPEITIALILGKATACWASDGTSCGTDYFTNKEITEIIPLVDFYKKHIQQFIDHLS